VPTSNITWPTLKALARRFLIEWILSSPEAGHWWGAHFEVALLSLSSREAEMLIKVCPGTT